MDRTAQIRCCSRGGKLLLATFLGWLATPILSDVTVRTDRRRFTEAEPDKIASLGDDLAGVRTARSGQRPSSSEEESAAETDGRIPAAQVDSIIRQFARRYHVECALVKAVIQVESGFNRLAVSERGARGLMQLMPQIAQEHGVRDAHDPSENIQGGVKYLRTLLDHFHNNVRLAVAAYNAGPSAVKRYRGLPPYRETRRYVARVLRVRQRYLKEERFAKIDPSSLEPLDASSQGIEQGRSDRA